MAMSEITRHDALETLRNLVSLQHPPLDLRLKAQEAVELLARSATPLPPSAPLASPPAADAGGREEELPDGTLLYSAQMILDAADKRVRVGGLFAWTANDVSVMRQIAARLASRPAGEDEARLTDWQACDHEVLRVLRVPLHFQEGDEVGCRQGARTYVGVVHRLEIGVSHDGLPYVTYTVHPHGHKVNRLVAPDDMWLIARAARAAEGSDHD